MMNTSSKKESCADMAFTGDKRMFATWKDTIIGHLRALGSQRLLDDLNNKRQPPLLSFEQMLTQVAVVPEPGPDDDPNKGIMQKAQLSQQEDYIKNLLNRTLPYAYRNQLTVSVNQQLLPAMWRQLEADVGQNSAQGMVETLKEFEY